MTTHVESLYASTDPHSTVGDALAQLKARLDATIRSSIDNVERLHGPHAMWEIEASGHDIIHLPAADGDSSFIASAVVLISFASQS